MYTYAILRQGKAYNDAIARVKATSMEREYEATWHKIKHYLTCETENKLYGINISRDIMDIYIIK